MLFNSLTFVVFFAIVLALHYSPFPWRARKFNLLIASYLFYAAWNPPFVVLLWISTMVDWTVAKKMHLEQRTAQRRLLLTVSILVNLGILGFFKYGSFLLDNWVGLMALAGIEWQAPGWDIVLPVGISFYTFQTMAYSLDIYLKRAEPAKSFLDFTLFVTFFPQLVAGPIVRPTHLIPQFAVPRVASLQQLGWGLGLMVLGIFQKVVVADGLLAPAAEKVFDAKEFVSFWDAWLGTLAFSGQIFCDFAGYSTTAIGVALTLGFSLPNNFRFPYAAIGFSDFWRRWHISLSTWLRDYLYIPLGGNRKGPGRTYVNLMVTMLLGGLWHGASWTFVVWGGLHGLYLAVERLVTARYAGVAIAKTWAFHIFMALFTYFLVNLTWVFFRAPDFATAWRMITAMFGFAPADAGTPLPTLWIIQVVVTIVAMVAIHWRMRDTNIESIVSKTPAWLLGVTLAAMLFLIIITQGSGNAFIYFQF
ncbi:MAG: MBOAT family protein [Gammaproteobacteria bacterium]|nr:MBOAT family protein [Gammaproteobacteria bacterium]